MKTNNWKNRHFEVAIVYNKPISKMNETNEIIKQNETKKKLKSNLDFKKIVKKNCIILIECGRLTGSLVKKSIRRGQNMPARVPMPFDRPINMLAYFGAMSR